MQTFSVSLAIQEFLHFVSNLNVHNHDNNRGMFSLSCARLIHSRPLNYIPSKYPLLYPPSTKRCPNAVLSFRLPNQNSLCFSLLRHTCYMHDPLYPRSFGRFYIRHSSTYVTVLLLTLNAIAMNDASAAHRRQLWRFVTCCINVAVNWRCACLYREVWLGE